MYVSFSICSNSVANRKTCFKRRETRKEMHTNINENKLSWSIIKTALVGFEVKIVALKYADIMLQTTRIRICLFTYSFVFKFPFSVKMLAINGMFKCNMFFYIHDVKIIKTRLIQSKDSWSE